MCGMVGQRHDQRGEAISRAELTAVCGAQNNRGPDGAGRWVDDDVQDRCNYGYLLWQHGRVELWFREVIDLPSEIAT